MYEDMTPNGIFIYGICCFDHSIYCVRLVANATFNGIHKLSPYSDRGGDGVETRV